jgi:urate oxidase
MGISLGANQYGKAENRVVRVLRDTPRHEIVDLNVSTSLRGDFARAHVAGDQADVLPTDTQKNTAFALAKRHGVSSPEDYAIALGRRLLEATPKAQGAQIRVDQYGWARIPSGPDGHDHAFVRRGDGTRTTVVTVRDRGEAEHVSVVSGLADLVLLKSTGSEFKGFLKDEYTTLAETDDRIMATSLVARWRYANIDVDWNACYEAIRVSLLDTFATTYSRALQETLYLMGSRVLESHDDVVEIRFSAPNKHHFLVDLEPFGLRNDGEVFIAADRPYGLIEATVARDDAPDAGDAWLAVPAFA